MLSLFMFNNLLSFGYVDKIENSIAVIEFSIDNVIEYKHVKITNDSCTIREGDMVAVNKKNNIICINN